MLFLFEPFLKSLSSPTAEQRKVQVVGRDPAGSSEEGWEWTSGPPGPSNISVLPSETLAVQPSRPTRVLVLWTLKPCRFFFFFFLNLFTSWRACQVFYPRRLLMNDTCLCFLHPSEDQKVAGVALRPTREAHPEGSHSLSTTHPFLPFTHPRHQTRVAFFKDKRHGCHLCASHICSLLLVFSVLSIPALCGKCCVPLFCFCGGFLSLCLKDTSNSGQRDARCLGRQRNGYFLLSEAVIDFAHCFSFSLVLWKTS